MCRSPSQRLSDRLPLILMVAVLTALWASPGHAHSGYEHQVVSTAVAGLAATLGAQAEGQMASTPARVRANSGSRASRASAGLPVKNRQVVGSRSADKLGCGSACGEGCIGCNCGSCLGTCSIGNACAATCASVHGAIVAPEASAMGISEALRFRAPMAHRINGRTVSTEPPPPKS